jgi:hypothetical protein
MGEKGPDYLGRLDDSAVIEPTVKGPGFRLAQVEGNHLWLEFEPGAAVEDGLRAFLRGWTTARVRPKGSVFRVWVAFRDYHVMTWAPPELWIDRTTAQGYLLLRTGAGASPAGCDDLGWALIRPTESRGDAPELIGFVPDTEVAAMSGGTNAAIRSNQG